MKQIKACSLLLCLPLLLCLNASSNVFAEVNKAFTVKLITPGMTESIDIGQLSAFPLGCPIFIIFLTGQGTFGISLKKDDTAGDIIFMLGNISSSAGSVPFFRVSQTKGMIDQIAEVGSQGFAWVYCGVAYSATIPKYRYQLRLSLQP
jgi:hypothetical protein